MNLTTTVSERDKKLLYFVSLIGFLVLFVYFGLLPTLERRETAIAELKEAEQTREAMEFDIMMAPSAAQSVIAARNQLEITSADYYGMLTNDELDGLVTNLVLAHGLEPLTLRIGGRVPQALAGYVASDQAGATVGKSQPSIPDPNAEGEDLSIAAQAAEAAMSDTIYVSQLTCTASGTREQFRDLLDSLAAHYPAIQITSWSVSDSNYATVQDGAQTSTTFSYTLMIYMCNREASEP